MASSLLVCSTVQIGEDLLRPPPVVPNGCAVQRETPLRLPIYITYIEAFPSLSSKKKILPPQTVSLRAFSAFQVKYPFRWPKGGSGVLPGALCRPRIPHLA
jgi:hypothetical protein